MHCKRAMSACCKHSSKVMSHSSPQQSAVGMSDRYTQNKISEPWQAGRSCLVCLTLTSQWPCQAGSEW